MSLNQEMVRLLQVLLWIHRQCTAAGKVLVPAGSKCAWTVSAFCPYLASLYINALFVLFILNYCLQIQYMLSNKMINKYVQIRPGKDSKLEMLKLFWKSRRKHIICSNYWFRQLIKYTQEVGGASRAMCKGAQCLQLDEWTHPTGSLLTHCHEEQQAYFLSKLVMPRKHGPLFSAYFQCLIFCALGKMW